MGTALFSSRSARASKRNSTWLSYLWQYRYLYLLAAPLLIWVFLFRWMTIYGAVAAWKSFSPLDGLWGSPWVGWMNFKNVLNNPELGRLVVNALILNGYKILIALPAGAVLALILNELRHRFFKRTVQTVLYLPHFITWIIIGTVFWGIFNYSYGILNTILIYLGRMPVMWYQSPQYWRAFIVGSSIWKELGWSTIIYTAMLSSVNPETYEAAIVDGANKFQQIRWINLPQIMPVIGFNLVFMIAGIIHTDASQIYALANAVNYDVLQVIDTVDYFLFRCISPLAGASGFDLGFGFLTAMGIMQATVGVVLFLIANRMAQRFFRWTGMF
ncbi:MAG: ABC transporter permease subunit [Limnochordia bacterium]